MLKLGVGVSVISIMGVLAVATPDASADVDRVFLTPSQCTLLSGYLSALEAGYRKEVRRYDLNTGVLADYERVKKDLLSDAWWATSDVSSIPEAMRALANGVLKAAAMTGGPAVIATGYTITDVVLHGLKTGKSSEAILVDIGKELAFDRIAENFGPAIQAADLLRTKAEGAIDIVADAKARKELQEVVVTEIKKIDEAIAAARANLLLSERDQAAFFKAKSQIEEVLRLAKCGTSAELTGTWKGVCKWVGDYTDPVTLTLHQTGQQWTGRHISRINGAASDLSDVNIDLQSGIIRFVIFTVSYSGSIAARGDGGWRIQVSWPGYAVCTYEK